MKGHITPRKLIAQFENWPQDIAGTPVDDTGWFTGAIYGQLLVARATILKADMDRAPLVLDEWAEQVIGCVMLEEVPTEECPCAPPSGCTWWRTVIPVPDPIGEYKAVTSIGGNLGKNIVYQYRDWYSIKYSLVSRLQAERDRPYYTKKNNYIYVYGTGAPLAITSVFYEPVEAQRIDCNGIVDYCKPFLDFDFYIAPHHEQVVIASAFQLITGMRAPAAFDVTSNAQPPISIEPIKPN